MQTYGMMLSLQWKLISSTLGAASQNTMMISAGRDVVEEHGTYKIQP